MPRYARGARLSPRHKLAAARPHVPRAVPSACLYFPSQLSFWGNETDGDCVTAEECFAKGAWSTMLGLPDTFITEQEAITWATAHGYLDGASLTEVMDTAGKVGLVASDGKTYTTGPYESVNWNDNASLFSGIFTGASVKIAVAADQFQTAADTTNGQSGWVATGFTRDGNIDHCVGLCGYGSAFDLSVLLDQRGHKVTIPSNLAAGAPCAAVFTWDSIGIIDLVSLRNVTEEAWVRQPVTVQQPVPLPLPTPGPTPSPSPSPAPASALGPHQILADTETGVVMVGSAIRPRRNGVLGNLLQAHRNPDLGYGPGWTIQNG